MRAHIVESPGKGCGGAHGEEPPRGAALTRALRAALFWQQDRLCTRQQRAAAGQALHVASLHGQVDHGQAALVVGGQDDPHPFPPLGAGPLLASPSLASTPLDSSSHPGSRLTRQ